MHRRLGFFFLFVLLSFPFYVSGQNVDSLKQVIANLPNDSNKVNELNSISWSLLFSLRDSSVYFIDNAISLADKVQHPAGKAKALKNKGILMDMSGHSKDAIKNWKLSQSIFNQLGNEKEEANIFNNIGIAYYNLGDLDSAEYSYNRSLSLVRKTKFKKGESRAYNNLARIYDTRGDFITALGFYLQALEINRELGDEFLMSGNLNNLGVINQEIANYPPALEFFQESLAIDRKLGRQKEIGLTLTNIGYTHFLREELDSAMVYYQEALVIQEELDVQSEVAIINNNIGRVYIKKGEYDQALPYIEKAIAIRTELEDQMGINYCKIPLGEVLYGLGKTKEAIKTLEDARTSSIDNNILTNIMDADEVLAMIYKAEGQYQLAIDRFEEYDRVRDETLDQEQSSKILQRQTDHFQQLAQAREERDQAIIEAAEAQRQILYGGIIMAILAALALLNRYRYVRKSRNIISREKQKSDDLLLNILPEKTAEELKEKGSAKAQRFNEVSILFTDFSGFTAASGVMDPAALVSLLHECFSAFDDIVSKYNVEKIKTIGDAYMCVSGLPGANPNHARDLVLAGLEFQSFVESKRKGDFPFAMRLGVHSGSVVSGIVGKKKFAYDIWGDAVNTAARMESNGEIGRVNISEATYQLIKDEFDCESRGEIEAKGKGKLAMYFVNGLKEEINTHSANKASLAHS